MIKDTGTCFTLEMLSDHRAHLEAGVSEKVTVEATVRSRSTITQQPGDKETQRFVYRQKAVLLDSGLGVRCGLRERL